MGRQYIAIGEEASRGTKEVTTVAFIPLWDPLKPKPENKDDPRKQTRGEDSILGDTQYRRMSRGWSSPLVIPMYSEAGVVKAGIARLVKHLTGKCTSVQNAATGQYAHVLYPVSDPFDAANLGSKALTLNQNQNIGTLMENWPWVGGRVKDLELDQQPGVDLKATFSLMGQFLDAVGAELGSAVFPDESLRLDYKGFKLYTGAITRVGTAPDYTDLTFSGATLIKPDTFKVKVAAAREDKLRLAGVDYPDKTRTSGKYDLTGEFTIDWEDPSSGFSSYDEVKAWLAGITELALCAMWDSGTQAGTGDHHSLYCDIPRALIQGDLPAYDPDKDPIVTIKFKAQHDPATTKYPWAFLFKNTAISI
jgi:hypothetical protein